MERQEVVRLARRSEGLRAMVMHGFLAVTRVLDFVLSEVLH